MKYRETTITLNVSKHTHSHTIHTHVVWLCAYMCCIDSSCVCVWVHCMCAVVNVCNTNTNVIFNTFFTLNWSIVNMMDENSMPLSITSTTGFGDCSNNAGSVSSSTEQFIICCKVCGSLNGLRRCSRCKSVYYCSQVHQQVDWRVHKIECKKFAANNLANSELKIWVFK